MTIIVNDTFTRANSTTTLGTTETGQVWQKYGSTVWGIQTNQAYPRTLAWDYPVYVETGVSDNFDFTIKYAVTHSSNQIMWRITSSLNFFVIEGTNVRRVVGNVWVTLGTIPTLVSGDLIKIQVRRYTHTIYVNGIQRFTFNDIRHINGTKVGFSTNSTTSRIDDFKVEYFEPVVVIPDVPTTDIIEDFLDSTYNFTFIQDPISPMNRFDTASLNGNLGHIKSSNQGINSSNSGIAFELLVPSNTTRSWVEVDYVVDSELNWDFMYIYVDEVERLKLSGSNITGTFSFDLLAGTHTIRFNYFKDGATNSYTDSLYISGLRLFHDAEVIPENILVKDSFTKANNPTSLGTALTGQTWQSYGTNNVWGIQNNQAYPITPDYDRPTYIEAGISDNVAFEVKIAVVDNAEQQIMWRIVDSGNYFCLHGLTIYQVSNDWELFPIMSIGANFNFVNGDIFRVELNGNRHVIKVNDVERITFISDVHLNGTKFGFSSGNTTKTVRYDDFLIENFSSPEQVIPDVPTTNIDEDFLDDTYNFTFTQGVLPWNRFNTASIGGNLGYMKSSNQGIDSSSSSITFDILVPANTIRSWIEVDYAVDSEINYDFLYIHLNGIEKLKVAGLNQTGMYTTDLPSGTHNLKLRFYKDGGAFGGTDSAYISGLRLFHTSPNVRYIRDWIGGNTTNNFRTWCEIQAIDMNGINVALEKPVTHSEPISEPFYNPQETNDGIVDAVGENGSGTSGASGDWETPMFVQIDLGSVIKLRKIKVWHDYSDGRTYQFSHLEVSEDGVSWTKLFDSEIDGRYAETAEGKTHILSTDASLTPPVVTSIIANKSKISDEIGANQSIITIQFDSNVTQYVARLNGVDHTTGVLVHSGGAISANTDAQVIIDWNELSTEGQNKINIYAENIYGWTLPT